MVRLVGIALLSGLGHSIRGKVRKHDAAADDCSSQWENKACQGQFGNEECYSCGSRIEYLISTGMSEADAKMSIAEQFFAACGKCAPISYDLETEGYKMVWNDEFDGEGSADSSKWSFVHDGSGFGNHELQYYTPRTENSWISDGTLKINAKREDYRGNRYTSAKLESKESWKYAKISVRSRVTTGRGTWAAIWTMPRNNVYGGWPRSGEIDIMEHVGYDTGKIHGTIHCLAYHHNIGTQIGGSTETDVTEFHEYTVEWRPDVILFACDQVVYQIFRHQDHGGSSTWPFDTDFYVILNLAVGGDWGAAQGVDEAAFEGEGQVMEVDYVRVEQRS